MNKILANLMGGIAGSIALTVLHETIRQFDDNVPRLDRIGEEGTNKVVQAVSGESITGKQLYLSSLSGDLVSNALYFSTVGMAKSNRLVWRGAATGLAAGIGALELTKKIGLEDKPINRSARTKALTIGYYLFGGLVAGLTIKALRVK